jgi:hypothetical protein
MPYAFAVPPIIFYVVALVLGLLNISLPFASTELHPLAQWMLFLALGVPSIFNAIPHVFFRERFARSFGWKPSPFQYDLAGATVGIGLGAIAAAVLGLAAAWAIFFVAASFMWGATTVHVTNMVRSGNLLTKNIGPILLWDILAPLTLLIALLK